MSKSSFSAQGILGFKVLALINIKVFIALMVTVGRPGAMELHPAQTYAWKLDHGVPWSCGRQGFFLRGKPFAESEST
jgi:hypothetical protein